MKVLMFGWEFPPHITGGLGTACFGLSKGLINNNVQVLFVVPKVYGDEDQNYVQLINASSIPLELRKVTSKEFWKNFSYIEVGSSLIPYLGPEEFLKHSKAKKKESQWEEDSIFSRHFEFSGKYGKDLMKEVARYALIASAIGSKYSFDIIHAHDWLTYPAGIAAKQISGKALVIHMHATEYDRSGDNINPEVYRIEKQGVDAADKIIAVSHMTKQILIEKYDAEPGKITVVHNAVEPIDADSLSYAEKGVKEKIVSFLGRITFQKGPDYFVEAAYKVLLKDENTRFVMAGSGDMLNRMIKRVAQLGISTKFHFTGFLKGDHVDRLFAMSDVYVMPSVSEPFGISPLEAMRSSVPVIISKQSGVSEVLKYAIKIDFWDIDAMADAIYGLTHYEALSKMFRKYGKSEVDNMKWDNAAFLVKKIYEQVLKSRKHIHLKD
jgi:glycogen synthase